MDSQVYVHDEYDSRGDISPEVVSQELDNVIQSYDTNDGAYTHDPYERDGKSNGTTEPIKDDTHKVKKRRKRDLQEEMNHYEDEVQTEGPLTASSPPADWKRTWKDYLKIIVIIITILTFVLNVGPFKRFNGNPIFNKNRSEISRKYPLGITPIREIFFVIWPVIYGFQGCWMGLCLVSIFTKTKRAKYIDGTKQTEFSYLCLYPDIFPMSMLLLYAVGQLAITAYKFVNDREELLLSLILLFVSSAFFHFSLISAVKGLHESIGFMTPENVDMKFRGLLKAYKAMLHLFYVNGISIIATWQIVAFSLGFCKYLIHGPDITLRAEAAYSVAYCIILFYSVSFFVVDVFVVKEATRWIYTSYGALLAAVVGSLVKILQTPARNRSQVTEVEIFFLVAVVVTVTVMKVVAISVRVVQERRRKDKDIDTLVKNGLTTL